MLPGNTSVMNMLQITEKSITPNVPLGRATALRRGLKRVLAGGAWLLNECCGPREKQAFGILMYHRVADAVKGKPNPTWNVPPERMEEQLAGLLDRGWQAWPLSQVLDHTRRGLPIPRKMFVVTFDDGYANNLHFALPVLTKLGVPATVFLATAYLDTGMPFPNDDWVCAGQPGVPTSAWRPLTTAECRQLTANGLVELGAHTHTHADFRGRPDALAEDLRENLAILRERFGIERPAFAFPYGTKCEGFASPALVRVVQEAGLPCSLTTQDDVVRPGDSPFDWGRITANDYDRAATLASRLGAWHSALRKLANRPFGFWSRPLSF